MINHYKSVDNFIIDKLCQPLMSGLMWFGLRKSTILKTYTKALTAIYAGVTILLGMSGFFGWWIVSIMILAKLATTSFASFFIHIHAHANKNAKQTPSIRETGLKDRFKTLWLYIILEIALLAVFVWMVLTPHKAYLYSNTAIIVALLLWTVTAVLGMAYKWLLCCRGL